MLPTKIVFHSPSVNHPHCFFCESLYPALTYSGHCSKSEFFLNSPLPWCSLFCCLPEINNDQVSKQNCHLQIQLLCSFLLRVRRLQEKSDEGRRCLLNWYVGIHPVTWFQFKPQPYVPALIVITDSHVDLGFASWVLKSCSENCVPEDLPSLLWWQRTNISWFLLTCFKIGLLFSSWLAFYS